MVVCHALPTLARFKTKLGVRRFWRCERRVAELKRDVRNRVSAARVVVQHPTIGPTGISSATVVEITHEGKWEIVIRRGGDRGEIERVPRNKLATRSVQAALFHSPSAYIVYFRGQMNRSRRRVEMAPFRLEAVRMWVVVANNGSADCVVIVTFT